MAEAALVMPLFLAVLLGAIRILFVCYQGIRLQYEVSETMRMTFTLDKAARGQSGWQQYFTQTLSNRAQAIRLSGLLSSTQSGGGLGGGGIASGNIAVQYRNGTAWPNSAALPGDTVSVTILSTEPILPAGLIDVSSFGITLRAKAVAIIHRTQDE